MDIRITRQEEAADAWMASDHKSIIAAAPRFGKTYAAVNVFNRIESPRIRICYPRTDIKEGWLDTFKTTGFKGDVSFHTFHGLKDLLDDEGSVFVIDECQEATSDKISGKVGAIGKKNKVMGLSGTMTGVTRKQLLARSDLDISYEYSIGQAVDEGVLTDYTIEVIEVPLDNKKTCFKNSKGKWFTEQGEFNRWHWVMEQKSNKEKFFFELKLNSLLSNSKAKIDVTKELLDRFSDERVLVFCGNTNTADSLGIPAYHSKSKDKEMFSNFCTGNGVNQMASVNMVAAGIKILPINIGVVNHNSGEPESFAQRICRMMSPEMGSPGKKARIFVISSDEPYEQMKIKSCMSFFDPKKIIYLKD